MTRIVHDTEAPIETSPERIERRLRELLDRSERQLIELELGLSGMLADRGTIQEDRDNTGIVVDAIRADVWRTKRALSRLDAGTYGRCTRCGTSIAAGRLDAIPIVEHCTACA